MCSQSLSPYTQWKYSILFFLSSFLILLFSLPTSSSSSFPHLLFYTHCFILNTSFYPLDIFLFLMISLSSVLIFVVFISSTWWIFSKCTIILGRLFILKSITVVTCVIHFCRQGLLSCRLHSRVHMVGIIIMPEGSWCCILELFALGYLRCPSVRLGSVPSKANEHHSQGHTAYLLTHIAKNEVLTLLD